MYGNPKYILLHDLWGITRYQEDYKPHTGKANKVFFNFLFG